MALELPELSPRELAVRFTDERSNFSEASVYRLLKAHDLITSPAYVVIKAANEFKDKTTAINQLWQTDFTYLKITGWGWYYLSTVLDDFSRYIVAWRLGPPCALRRHGTLDQRWRPSNWVAIGKVSVLAGEGGRGKSTILCDLAARTTASNRWPDGAAASPAGGVIILAAEDDVGDTLAPRLLAAGAEMARVFVIRSVRDEKQRRRGFNLQADLERLEVEITKRDNIRLIIIDPVSSYLGPVDSHKNADVRAVLEPLGEMAARMRVAIICNNHFSKGAGSANNRVIGSVAFVNQARAAFIVTPDENDDTRMLLIPSKMNIAPIRHGLAYRIEGCLIHFEGSEIATSRIMYEGTPVTISADQALAALSGHGENKSEKSEAIEFLKELLKAGPMAAKDVKKEATDAGFSPKSLRSAREALRIKPEKTGFEGGWAWKLPKMPSEAEDARETQRAPSRV